VDRKLPCYVAQAFLSGWLVSFLLSFKGDVQKGDSKFDKCPYQANSDLRLVGLLHKTRKSLLRLPLWAQSMQKLDRQFFKL